jgi:hypothetical protein
VDLAGGLADPLAAVVFAGMSHRVRTSIINGRIVVDEGKLVTVDEDEIARRARSLSLRMLRQAGCELPYGHPEW